MVTPTSKTSRVLIIDDSQEAVTVLVALLERFGYDVISAYDGREALKILRLHAFDLAILDNEMPNLGGIETLTELRDFLPNMPVIVCSGAITERETTRYRELGISDLVRKPIDTRTLLAKVASALEHHAPHGAAPTLIPTRYTSAPFATTTTSPLFAGTSMLADQLQQDFNRLRAFRSIAIIEGPVGSGRFELALGLAPATNVHSIVCHADELTGDHLDTLLIPAAADGKPIFLIVLDAERIPEGRQLLMENLVRGRIPQHAEISKTLRVVFTSQTSLCDNHFNEFLLMRAVASTRQLPSFAERRQDWAEISRAVLARVGTGRGAFAQTSLRWITNQNWPGNYMQLHRTIELARRRAGVEAVIMVEHLEAALLAEKSCDEPLFHDVLYHVHSGHD